MSDAMHEHATLNFIDYAVFFVYMTFSLLLGFTVARARVATREIIFSATNNCLGTSLAPPS